MTGFPSTPSLAAAGEAVTAAMDSVTTNHVGAARPKLQQPAVAAAMGSLYPDSLPELLCRRFREWFPDLRDEIAVIDWPVVRAIVGKLPVAHATAILKKWCGAWATSNLLHCGPRGCLLGCDAADDLSHYVKFPRLRQLFAARGCVQDACPLVRLGVRRPDRSHLLKVVVAFHWYNVFRHMSVSVHAPTAFTQAAEALNVAWRLADLSS